LGAAAAARDLPASPERIDSLVVLTRQARDGLRAAIDRRREATAAQARSAQAEAEHRERQADVDRGREELRRAEGRRDERRIRLEQLSDTLGRDVQEVLARIEAEEARRKGFQEQLEAVRREERAATERLTRHRTRAATLRESLPDLRDRVGEAEARLQPFHHGAVQRALGLSADGGDLLLRLAEVVEGASRSDEQLKSTETRLNGRLHELDDALGAGVRSVRSSDDGVTILEVADADGRHGLHRFEQRLSERPEETAHLLDQHERRLFEDQLLGALTAQLRERVDGTHQLVRSMDAAMAPRTLASGKRLSIRWRPRPDTDPGRKELLELLKHDPAFHTPERLARLRGLLSQEVQTAHRERPDRTYLEILDEAVDYRRWHRFELELCDPDNSRTRLTRARHAQLSGGEKAATLHLPLFAAAHAWFEAAAPGCPRLIALDEAFAGIDDVGVPELLRLAAAFDLDFFFTGYDLWITESFLPGVMHYDLAHEPRDRVVSAWPVLWNGRETVEGDEALQ
jgi:hypothetical protein